MYFQQRRDKTDSGIELVQGAENSLRTNILKVVAAGPNVKWSRKATQLWFTLIQKDLSSSWMRVSLLWSMNSKFVVYSLKNERDSHHISGRTSITSGKAGERSEAKDKQLHRAARELEVFLSFLVTREHIQEYVEEFNKQSSGSRINVEEGRAKIVLR